MPQPDIVTMWTPSFCLVRAETDEGRDWLEENCPGMADDLLNPTGYRGACDHRYIGELVEGAVAEGLLVMDTGTGRYAK